MTEFTDLNIFTRSSVNGAMALSALLLIVIFGRYVWQCRPIFWRSSTAQAAGAVLILMIGHFSRATSSWIEFTLIALGRSTETWLQWTWVWFLIAVPMILWGKALMIYVFAPYEWRWWYIGVGLPACIVIPVALITALLYIN